jgi:hypothetical protein
MSISDPPPKVEVPRDWRAVLVAVVGILSLAAIVVFAVGELPGEQPRGTVNTKGAEVVAISSAAFTAVGTLISAYFGIKAANAAREDTQAGAKDVAATAAEYAGALPPADAEAVSQRLQARGM